MTHFVYLAETTGKHRKKIKIGHTWNVRLRVTTLARQKRRKMRALAYIPCSDVESARDIERRLHDEFRPVGCKKEWHLWSEVIVARFFAETGVVACP